MNVKNIRRLKKSQYANLVCGLHFLYQEIHIYRRNASVWTLNLNRILKRKQWFFQRIRYKWLAVTSRHCVSFVKTVFSLWVKTHHTNYLNWTFVKVVYVIGAELWYVDFKEADFQLSEIKRKLLRSPLMPSINIQVVQGHVLPSRL